MASSGKVKAKKKEEASGVDGVVYRVRHLTVMARADNRLCATRSSWLLARAM